MTESGPRSARAYSTYSTTVPKRYPSKGYLERLLADRSNKNDFIFWKVLKVSHRIDNSSTAGS